MVKVKCKIDGSWLPLCPPRSDLSTILSQHIQSKTHLKAMEMVRHASTPIMSGFPGRPRKQEALPSNQQTLSKFLVSTLRPSSSQECEFSTPHYFGLSLLCWGYWHNNIVINDEEIHVKSFLIDQNHGALWFSEPYTKAIVMYEMQECVIDGCFRHFDCKRVSKIEEPFHNLTCEKCNEIPKCNDFHMRVYRERRAKVKRGNRGTGEGRRLDYLTKEETRKEISSSKQTIRRAHRQIWWLACKVAMLSVKVMTLKEASLESVERKDVRRFCNNIIEAHRAGKFGGKNALWDFLTDVAQNLTRKPHGQRFKDTSKAIFVMIKMWGGPRLHDFVSKNLDGPSLSTTKRVERKATKFLLGIHDYIFQDVAKIYENEKRVHGIITKVPFIIVEDETVIKRNVKWDSSNDLLLGFCGLKSSNHQCVSSCMIKVGDSNAGYETIVSSFKDYVVGHYARVLIANPLHPKLPRLVLVVQCTCNCFDADFVKCQWNEVETLWEKHLSTSIGPIVGHASDGDSRRRKIMLQDYLTPSICLRYKLPWDGWIFTGQMHNDMVSCLHDQDFIHNGKKLVNALDNPSRQLVIGDVWITLNHVSLVYNNFSIDAHGLRECDITREDRQNWAGAQRIASRNVTNCLKMLYQGGEGVKVRERGALGTHVYLHILGDYIDIFLSPHESLFKRVVLASKVAFFFQIWRLWILDNPIYNLKSNFISRETFLDVQISCHFVVLLIKMFRDFYPQLECPLHLTGSDGAEIFFSKIGGMIGMERAFDISDVLHCSGNVNKLAKFECIDNGLVFPRAHKKQESIWSKLNFMHDKPLANLKDYIDISNDDQLVFALKEGLKEAQILCESLNMKPKHNGQWWNYPGIETKQSLSYIYGEKDDEECAEHNKNFTMHECVENDDEIAISEIRHELDAILDDNNVNSKVSSFVQVDDKIIFKSTLVSHLNGNPTLSKDRLTRVREGVFYSCENANDFLNGNGNLIGIGSDCVVFFTEEDVNSTRPKRKGISNKNVVWYLGRVQRMRRKIGNKFVEYKRGIDLMDRLEDVQLQLGWYRKIKGSRLFAYDLTDIKMVDFESIIGLANLTYNAKCDNYLLDESDCKVFNDFLLEMKSRYVYISCFELYTCIHVHI